MPEPNTISSTDHLKNLMPVILVNFLAIGTENKICNSLQKTFKMA